MRSIENIKCVVDMIKKMEVIIESAYPIWSALTDEEKNIVNKITVQIPLSCEVVATIFVLQAEKNEKKTKDYLYINYGYFID